MALPASLEATIWLIPLRNCVGEIEILSGERALWPRPFALWCPQLQTRPPLSSARL
jgi:hypothetical protein